MDLFEIAASLRRHWLISVVIAALTLVGAFGMLKLTPREYNSNASFVLVNPSPPPTEAQILKDPALGQVNRNNPYLRFASEGTVEQVLADRMSGDSVREALVGQGADVGYTIVQSPTSSQILDVVGTGHSATEADRTLDLVSHRMQQELYAMQKVYGADNSALITMLPVAAPTRAHLMISGTIRTIVGILAAGVILLFVAISVAEARDRTSTASSGPGRRAPRSRTRRQRGTVHPSDGAAPLEDDRDAALAAPPELTPLDYLEQQIEANPAWQLPAAAQDDVPLGLR